MASLELRRRVGSSVSTRAEPQTKISYPYPRGIVSRAWRHSEQAEHADALQAACASEGLEASAARRDAQPYATAAASGAELGRYPRLQAGPSIPPSALMQGRSKSTSFFEHDAANDIQKLRRLDSELVGRQEWLDLQQADLQMAQAVVSSSQ